MNSSPKHFKVLAATHTAFDAEWKYDSQELEEYICFYNCNFVGIYDIFLGNVKFSPNFPPDIN